MAALVLLAVSYPVGILTNFPIYKYVQVPLISRRIRRHILQEYAQRDIDLTALVSHHLGVSLSIKGLDQEEQIRATFRLMRAFAFAQNIERLNANHLYHEGLQRLARGMFLPLLLAAIAIYSRNVSLWAVLVIFCGLLACSAGALIVHSIRTEEEQLVRFFLILTQTKVGYLKSN